MLLASQAAAEGHHPPWLGQPTLGGHLAVWPCTHGGGRHCHMSTACLVGSWSSLLYPWPSDKCQWLVGGSHATVGELPLRVWAATSTNWANTMWWHPCNYPWVPCSTSTPIMGQDETAAAAGSWSKALGIDEQRF